MRLMRRAVGAPALVAGALILMSGALRASDAPVVHVKAVVKNGNVTLEAEANGPFEYTTYRPSESLFVLDLTGVSSADPAGARVVASDLVKSYRMLTNTAGAKAVGRVEILLSQGVEPRLERRDSQELMLLVSRTDEGAPKAAVTGPAPSMQPTIQPIAAKSSTKSSEIKTSGSTSEAIRQVKLEQNGELTDVNVIGTGKLNYHAMKLQNPDRLELDFAGAHLRTSEKQIASTLDPVREIRLAQFSPEVSRIVIDLRHASPYNITTSDSGITVEFANKSSKSAAGSGCSSGNNFAIGANAAKLSVGNAFFTATTTPGTTSIAGGEAGGGRGSSERFEFKPSGRSAICGIESTCSIGATGVSIEWGFRSDSACGAGGKVLRRANFSELEGR